MDLKYFIVFEDGSKQQVKRDYFFYLVEQEVDVELEITGEVK